MSEFYVATLDEMAALMVYANRRYALTGSGTTLLKRCA